MAFDRKAGEHARWMVRYHSGGFLLVLVVLCAITVAAGAALGFTTITFAAVEAALIAAMWIGNRLWWPRIERWDAGATGEESVGELLVELRRHGWHVLHDVVVGSRGNIDHVVFGPGGLFTIETKSHWGNVRVTRAMLSQAYAEAKLVERLVDERVTPLLVFSRATQVAVRRRRGVTVLLAGTLVRYLERQPATLAPERAAALHHRLGTALAGR